MQSTIPPSNQGVVQLEFFSLQPPEEERAKGEAKEEEEEEDVIPTTPIPQAWECLGSDLEIREGHFTDKRPLVMFIPQYKPECHENVGPEDKWFICNHN